MAKKKRLKNLEELKALSLSKKKKDAYSLPYEKRDSPKPQEPEQPNEDEIFMNAMRGVKQMGDSGGRQVAPESKPAKSQPRVDENDPAQLQRFLQGDVEFELEYTDEFMYGFVRGLDIKTFQQLKSGSLSVNAHLDLHGMTTDQAQESLLFFMRESYLQSRRCVLVVTGRGINSPGGHAILRRETESWLTRDPLKRIVLAFCTAQPKDGGAGALYVLLRKQKKTQGKITWDKMFNDG